MTTVTALADGHHGRARSAPDVERLARDIRAGERNVLSRAITLIESKRADHRHTAAALTQALLATPAKRCASASPARRASANRP